MDCGDSYWELYRDYYRDPFPDSLLSTRQVNRSRSSGSRPAASAEKLVREGSNGNPRPLHTPRPKRFSMAFLHETTMAIGGLKENAARSWLLGPWAGGHRCARTTRTATTTTRRPTTTRKRTKTTRTGPRQRDGDDHSICHKDEDKGDKDNEKDIDKDENAGNGHSPSVPGSSHYYVSQLPPSSAWASASGQKTAFSAGGRHEGLIGVM